MLWVATESVEVVKLARLPESPTVPSTVVPSRNVTLPVGTPVPGLVTLTVAVKLTLWPYTEGLPEPTSATVVAA